MSGREDGGQAFPQPVTVGPNDDMYPAYPGMTLRDYFAAHVDQPGEAEIIVAAGLMAKSPAGYLVVLPNGDEITFAEWWRDLPQAERFALYAKVRYGMADAMIAERST